MKIEVFDNLKFACVWLTKEESDNQEIKESLKPIMAEYKAKKYKFVVYHSGKCSLLEQTQDLLKHNKNLAINGR